MTVPVQIPVTTHIGNGVTTAFAYGFKILAEADIVVTVDGVVKTNVVDYAVTGVGVEGGGTITFTVAPAALTEISLYRQVALNRSTDYQYSGDFQSDVVNRDFDRLVMMMQDGDLAITNALRMPPGDLASGVLPSAANRALKGLAFDSSGNILLTAASGNADVLAAALASNTTASVGAGLVGYDAAQSYATGTVGKAIQNAVALGTRQQKFTANGSFVVPAGVTTIWASACAGGGGGGAGGGGGVANFVGGGGGGGGAGQFILEQAYAVTPGQVLAITIGALGAGAAGSVGAGVSGVAGGSTTIGGLAVLTGGAGGGGGANATTTAAGGAPGAGFPTASYGSDAGNGVAGSGNGGAGASGPFGGGGGAGRGAGGGGIFGAFAVGFGAGGGGGGGLYNGTGGSNPGGSGANGSPGLVIIRW